MKPYVATPRLNHLIEMVQMKGLNIFQTRINKNYPLIITDYSRLSRARPLLLNSQYDIVLTAFVALLRVTVKIQNIGTCMSEQTV